MTGHFYVVLGQGKELATRTLSFIALGHYNTYILSHRIVIHDFCSSRYLVKHEPLQSFHFTVQYPMLQLLVKLALHMKIML